MESKEARSIEEGTEVIEEETELARGRRGKRVVLGAIGVVMVAKGAHIVYKKYKRGLTDGMVEVSRENRESGKGVES